MDIRGWELTVLKLYSNLSLNLCILIINFEYFQVKFKFSSQIRKRLDTSEKKKSSPRVKKTKQESSDDEEDCAAPACLRPTGRPEHI